MWVALRTYVAVNTTDGDIPDEDIDDLPGAPKNPRRWLMALVECGKPDGAGGREPGLVDPIDGGWKLHNYSRHGLSAAEVERRKDAARERKRKWQKNKLGTQEERRSEHVPDAPMERDSERGSDDPPFPSPSPTPGEEIPLPPPEPRTKPPDPMSDSLRGRRTQDHPDVVRVFDTWKLAHGFTGAKFRSPADARADVLFEAVKTYGVGPCLRVLEASKTDPMVTGKADERGQEHRKIEYLFSPSTFDRLLRAADEQDRRARPAPDPVARARSATPNLAGYRSPTETQ